MDLRKEAERLAKDRRVRKAELGFRPPPGRLNLSELRAYAARGGALKCELRDEYAGNFAE
jgi:hypothetical protein